MDIRYITIFTALKFSTSEIMCKIMPKNAKGGSSNQWLRRQLNDIYVESAKVQNYRCRSAFKLLEIDAAEKLLRPGQCVIDCGAAPGSWTQVAVAKTNADAKNPKSPIGTVISIDKLQIHPINGATIFSNMDFTVKETIDKLNKTLNGSRVDVVLSDMAPNAAGIKFMDHERIITLGYAALRFAVEVSAKDASLLIKLWDGSSTQDLRANMRKHYKLVRFIKPKASRTASSELFLLGKNFFQE